METEHEQDSNLNINQVCRVCLKQNEFLRDICNETMNGICVFDMFNSITDFKVKGDDDMPQKMCDSCLVKLEISYKFIKEIECSHHILQKRKLKHEESFVFEIIEQYDCDDEPQPVQRATGRRLTEYSYNEVIEAIQASKKDFFENTDCKYCGFSASNSRALAVHMAHLHKEAKEKWCSRCNAEVEDLESHKITHNQEEKKCRFCNKTFSARGHLTEHLRSHTKTRPFKCLQCEKSFISLRHLKVHSRIHGNSTNRRPYKCHLCEKCFAQSVSLKNHFKVHGGDKNTVDIYPCDECGSFFSDENTLITHECAKSKIEGSYPQNFCTKCKRKVRSLSVHMKRVHLGEEKRVVDEMKLCTICGKQFKTVSKLNVHMRTHTGETPYKCSYCGKAVTTRNNLIVHERTHTGEKPHICTICGKRFAQSSCLNTHMRLHTGRPEVCNICEKRFCRPAELRLHMRKHTGEKPYLCVECGQTFVQRSHLTEHIKTHSEKRPFKCSYCNKGFKQNSSLKSHVQIHLGYKPYKCNQCPYACRQPYSLTQHMAQHSTDNPRSDKPHVCLLCHKNFSTVAMLISHTANIHNTNMLDE